MAKKQVTRKMAMRPGRQSRGMFGPVSSINTAPVSVGNSVRGSQPRVSQTTDGARVVGRDFAFALAGTASTVTNWELIGGMPVTPCCLPSSILRNYCQMFNKFKVNKFTMHYITSSPTSQAGDVLFYFEKDRLAPMPDYSNSSFLPYTLSDPHTVIGPQWTNHSATITPTKDWKTTLYGNQTDLNEDAEGTLFFFSKTNAANSPGYLLIDYDIQFKELSVNPRAGSLPVARAQSSFICLTNSSTTLNLGFSTLWSLTTGKNVSNVTSASPNGAIEGDIYKMVLQVTASQQVNAAWSGVPTPATNTLLRYGLTNRALTIDDGTTLYGALNSSAQIVLYATLEGAVTGTDPLEYATATTGATVNICAEMQLVRNVTDFTQSSY
nr:structural protein [Sobelivirales sp.]WRQ64839.1 structural protein [Sobelivirales sp.]